MDQNLANKILPHGQGGAEQNSSQSIVLEQASNELVFAVVGYIGSGTSRIAKSLKDCLEAPGLTGGHYETVILKARTEIEQWAMKEGLITRHELPDRAKPEHGQVTLLQDWGDKVREQTGDHSAIARKLIQSIRKTRAEKTGASALSRDPITPDGAKRAYILDSIRHPAEVHLLRSVYQDAFTLIGVVCDEEVRKERIKAKFINIGKNDAQSLVDRDSKAPEKHGQRVADAFHLSDFFVENTEEEKHEDDGSNTSENPDWDIPDRLNRLVEIITHQKIQRPKPSETAMFHADAARLRSACLSRQVGAALVNEAGNLIATGTNEVPKAGGGVYGASFKYDTDAETPPKDERCAFRSTPGCRSKETKDQIVDELVRIVGKNIAKDPEMLKNQGLAEALKQSPVGELLEFSRAVHAEMDALLTAAREGVSTAGTRLFVTTFPCHYCARHLVAAGVKEVQYIEPYFKSKAATLHSDAIATTLKEWKKDKTKVRFFPFSGVAPRMYRRAFLKDRDLKNDETGALYIQDPPWGSPWKMLKTSYVDLEAKLLDDE